MHTFLKSIGFSKINSQQELENLLNRTILSADKKNLVKRINKSPCIEYCKQYGENTGIIVRGEENENNEFRITHYFPYLNSTLKGMEESYISINKKIESDAYTGMCDDDRVGVTLIFFLKNIPDDERMADPEIRINSGTIKLSALAQSGTIILPTQKRVYSHIASKIDSALTKELMESVKNGNPDAINLLVGNQMDKTAQANSRLSKEDLYSIIENTFYPYGSESDLYSVLGNIVSSKQFKNTVTGENLWVIRIICNEIEFEIVINEEDLYGMPIPGMRFKGVIWMQGEIEPDPILY